MFYDGGYPMGGMRGLWWFFWLLRRGGPAVHPRARITDAPSAGRELRGMDLYL